MSEGIYKQVCDWCANDYVGDYVMERDQQGHGLVCRKCAYQIIKKFDHSGWQAGQEARTQLVRMANGQRRQANGSKAQGQANSTGTAHTRTAQLLVEKGESG